MADDKRFHVIEDGEDELHLGETPVMGWRGIWSGVIAEVAIVVVIILGIWFGVWIHEKIMP